MNDRRGYTILCLAVAALLFGMLVVACRNSESPGGQPQAEATADPTPTSTVGVTNPGPPVMPPPPDLSAPEPAVRSYLAWVSYAYRTADSDVASATMTPYEGVRVDSYIELNRQTDFRAIEQNLTRFEVRDVIARDDTATVVTHEEWAYRYFSMRTGLYVSEPLEASYDSTYTVVHVGDVWLVDRVEADPLVEVK